MEAAIWTAFRDRFVPEPPSPYLTDPVGWVEQRLGEHLWSKQREIMLSVRDHRYTAVQSCHDAGKCVYSRSMIPLADGRVVQAADLIGTFFEVLAFTPGGEQVPTKAWATDNGVKPVYRVRTAHGREVIRTGNHPLFLGRRTGGGCGQRSTVKSVGWTHVQDIAPGDLVLVPERLNVPITESPLADDQVKFIGYLLGDGGTTHYVGFTQQDGPAMDEFYAIAERMGGRVDRVTSNRYGVIVHGQVGKTGRTGTNHVLNFVRDHGMFGVKARVKRFPDVVWRLPDAQLALLLNRLFACDGYAYTRTDRGKVRAQIGITLASEGMIRDVELAALRLGIVGQTRHRTVKLNGKTFDAWEWALNRAADIQRFAEVVGIYGKEDGIAKVVAATSNPGRISQWMHRAAPDGYRWERVTEVEPLGPKPTVTISVEEHHTFVTTFVEHNSFIASRIVTWWLDVHPLGEAFGVTTAPTAPQVSAILWREIRRAHRKAGLRGYITQGTVPEWKLPDGEQIAYGRKPADHDQAAFQGIHSRYPIIVVDEACGVPKGLFDAVDALATNEHARVLAIGNPDDPSSHFAKICKPGSGWNVIRIDGLATPNMTSEAIAEHPRLAHLYEELGMAPFDEPIPDDLRALLLSPLWVSERIHRWGVASPIFEAKVRGGFPDIGDRILITPAMIRAAQERSLAPGPYGILGVDVARFGSDRTVIYLRRGPLVRRVFEGSKLPTTETTGHVIAAKRETGADEVRVDGVGIGGGVVDQLVENGHDVVDMQAGGRPNDPEHFLNARAEWYWALRQRFEDDEIDIDPTDEDLAAQLGSIQYKYTGGGQLQIESKDDMKKRGLPSPDRADAVMLTAAATPPPEQIVEDPEDDEDDHQISPY